MKLKELLNGIDYIKIEGLQDRYIDAMYYDSREVTQIPYFCIKGLTVDGHGLCPQAVPKEQGFSVRERCRGRGRYN